MSNKPKTRASTEYFLVGQTQECLSEIQLATAKDVLSYLLFRRDKVIETSGRCNPGLADVISCVQKSSSGDVNCSDNCAQNGEACLVSSVKKTWIKAGIPTIVDKNIRDKVKNLYETWRKQLKCRKRVSKAAVESREKFENILSKVFDIGASEAEKLIEQDRLRDERAKNEDINFLKDQRGDRHMVMGSNDV